MPRYVVDVRFNGTAYAGWQVQEGLSTVQGHLEDALSKILRTPITTYGAGRTDAGVHALQLPAQFDYDAHLHPHFHKAVNAVLPKDIAITRVYRALPPDFHVRFHGIARAYRYQMIFQKDPLRQNFSKWVMEKINVEAMMAAAPIVMEYESFESFTKSNGNQKTHLCTITQSHFEWEGDMLVYHIRANRFLRGMVRTIVGTLLAIGKGQLDQEGFRRIIESKDRRRAGTAELPCGLYLSEVAYQDGSLEEIHFPRQ
ncbi:MAG: tRNA pseudouridine(38-40) synthase TruA [Bacteroidota bacterium]|jgi:tRNA pseudouridine38-40 synthase